MTDLSKTPETADVAETVSFLRRFADLMSNGYNAVFLRRASDLLESLAARTIAASATASSSSVGSGTNRCPGARNGVIRSGSTAPSATNVSDVVDIVHPFVIRDAVVPATGSSFCH